MKKLLIGCGIVVLVVVVLLVGALIFVALKVKKVTGDIQACVEEIRQLDTKHPYTPPASGELDPDRFREYLEVRAAMIDWVDSHPTLSKLRNVTPGAPVQLGFGETMSLLTDVPCEAMQEVGRQLDSRQMSPSEFLHHVQVVYTTIGEGSKAGDSDMKELYDNLERGVDNVNDYLEGSDYSENQLSFSDALLKFKSIEGVALDRNMQLVGDAKDQMMEWPELTFLELLSVAAIEDAVKGNNPIGKPSSEAPAEDTAIPTKFGGAALPTPTPAN